MSADVHQSPWKVSRDFALVGPVTQRRRAAAHPQAAGLAVGHRHAAFASTITAS
jgi:hypothetical protein